MRINLFGCSIDNLTMQQTLKRVEECVLSKTPHQHVVVNVNKIVAANRDNSLKRIINSCDLINADGMPVVWVSRILGKPLKERVAGIDLFEKLLKRAENLKWRVYFLGASQDIITRMGKEIRRKYPGLIISGYRNGYWQKDEEPSIVDRIRNLPIDILFVGISSPRKEIFLNRYRKEFGIPFVMGVGGAFDVTAGKIKRAPGWMQKIGLEWFYRFMKEPRRLFKRYFIEGALFVYLVFKEIIKPEGKTQANNKNSSL